MYKIIEIPSGIDYEFNERSRSVTGCYRNQPRVIDARWSDTWFRAVTKGEKVEIPEPMYRTSVTRRHKTAFFLRRTSSAKPKPKPGQCRRAQSSLLFVTANSATLNSESIPLIKGEESRTYQNYD